MPITLPQLSRREFLKRAALAGAAAAFAPLSHAGPAAKMRDPDTFFFLSDTHIAANPAEMYFKVNMTDNLGACVRELAAWPVKPAAVIVNGDLAYLKGNPEDYATFAQGIAPVRALAPIHLSLGNHDEREHFWSAFPQDATKEESVPEKQASVFSSDRANWFLLDTLELTLKTPGQLGSAQITWLTHELDARPDKPAIVVLHHNPQFPMVTIGLLDTAALMEVLLPRRHVKALIFGHTHDWLVTRHPSDIHLINLPPTGYVFKKGRPSGWVRCALAGDGMELELRCLDIKHPEHGKVQTLKWRTV
jgi:predicted phosphodiesterase